MKIVRLEAERFKRLRAVEITPDGNMVPIRGANGEGKSSCLDAIQATLGGEKLAPDVPIRRGESSAVVTLDLGELVVTRRWSESGSRLEVASKDGATFKSPQAVLDKLVGPLSFDPLAFLRMDAKKQVALASELVGVKLDDLDDEAKRVYSERTIVNREAERLGATIPDVVVGDVPAEEVRIEDVLARIERAEKERAEHEGMISEVARARARHKEIAETIAKLTEEKKAIEARGKTLKAAIEAHKPTDLAALKREASEIQETNARVRAVRLRAETIAAHEKKKSEAAALSKRLIEIQEERTKRIKEAHWPVDGLGLSEDGLTLNGLPFVQASSAEQLRVSLAMGLALNPKLRVILIRDGSLLDERSLSLVAEAAKKADAQVWIEVVGTDGGPAGIVIEDGSVVGQATPEPEKPARKTPAKKTAPEPTPPPVEAPAPAAAPVEPVEETRAESTPTPTDGEDCPF